MKKFLAYIMLAIGTILSVSAREVYSLNNDWQFFFAEENSSDNAREISLPHTWNTDAYAGTGSYRQTSANYQRNLFIPSEWKDRKRIFLRFHGVQNVADVFVNGQHVGDHYGGYTAFAFEITNCVSYGYNNALLVAVSNTRRNDVLPASTEENVYGGIYRDVELIVTDKVAVSPLYYGSEGVMVHQTEVSKERVSGHVNIALTGRNGTQCNVVVSFIDPHGYTSWSNSVQAKIDDNLIGVPFSIENAALWSPAKPNLYTVRVTVNESDVVEVKTGFRNIQVTADKRFALNGRQVRIHGVLLGHDKAPKGNALSNSDMKDDLATIREMGANAVRSVTGPHSQHFYNECDRLGVLAWVDIPLTRAPFLSDISYYPTARFEGNGMQQLHEIILQNINHPSVAMWGIFSLMRGNTISQLGYIKKLNKTAKALDTTRPTVSCSDQDGNINFITDLIVWQQSIGWESCKLTDLEIWQDALRKSWKHLRQAICYGECSNVVRLSNATQNVSDSRSAKLRQQLFHEGYLQMVDENLFWGVWINSMFDTGSIRYTNDVRNSGVVSANHKDRKDLFYLYKSRWNSRGNTLYITNREEELRSNKKQVLTVYSSLGSPVMTINGDTVACELVSRSIYRTDSLTLKGTNKVRVSAGGKVDELTFTIGNYLRLQ